MQYTSEDLARELYELSGWESDVGTSYTPSAPYYTLGEMLRKLPRTFGDTDGQILYLMLAPSPTNNTQWEANYGGINYLGVEPYQCYADTPEGALVALAIELFKQGILTAGEKGQHHD